ncbi:hypothetical protein PV08_04716 [Exophiala spinifera]|uniref:Zn(2)-C6 fungal-type domain-containing protein n=1 Tax=Exophiala spinifera TaxID=91928 RepID=A0A0D1ZY35_9EURO|nr:uncharacterized protein PV08_04716 [Exophiala spinifera]KIW17522.1 hypothetical protein PV08_04716 [Exophiala spinifera]
MPRPKVRPEDRQRAVKACIPCKSSKKRCDAQQPCSNCVRKRAAETCEYAESMVRPRGIHAHTARAASVQHSSTTAVAKGDHERDTSTKSPVEEEYQSPVSATGKRKRSPARGASTLRRLSGGRLLLNSRGEKVYVGGTASLSFLQFLRHTLKQQMGPSVFTDNDRRNVMLEVRSPEDTNAIFEEDESQKRALVEIYFAATNGFLDLFTRDEIEAYLTGATTPADGVHEYAPVALDLVVAIGGQCRALGPHDLRYAVRCFSRAQKAAMASALEDPCLDMVRCFLLMAFYMLGACRRNAAFMYVGIAAQASSALGLHVTEEYRHFTVAERSVRLRTLKSLRVLDVLVCSILGRTYSTPAVRIDSASFTGMHVQPAKPRDMALNASFGACELIAEIMYSLDGNISNPIDTPTAKRFLERLRSWSANLPLEIRRFETTGKEPLNSTDQECIIGSIHVSCVYYFAVMLVTRPFLINHLMARLPGASSKEAAQTRHFEDAARAQDSEAVNLAQACIDSAILMAQTCFDALQGGILLQNMCIMKAWVFAAGLVLGFSMFAQGESPFDMDESFNGAREVLKKLAEHSPQAEHYYDILIGFADAIQRHRQHLSREKRRASGKYVNRILSLDVNVNLGGGGGSNTKNNANISSAGSQATFSPGSILDLRDRDRDTVASSTNQMTDVEFAASATPADADVLPSSLAHAHADGQTPFQLLGTPHFPVDSGGFDFGLFGWDNFAMQISENFSFDNYEDTWGPAE